MTLLLNMYIFDQKLKQNYPNFVKLRPVKAIRRRFRNYVLQKTKTNFVDLDGQLMHVDPSEYLKLVIADFRGLHTKYLKKNIKPGDIVIDVGANIGYFTCLMSKLVGETGHVYSFEPELNNFKMLKMNVEENNCSNVTIEQKAIGLR